MSKKRRSEKYHGVYIVEGKKGLSYGIDYVDPQTGRRIQKILKGMNSEKEASEKRGIEISDALRGLNNQAYKIQGKRKAMLFEDAIDLYLQWAHENKRSWKTDEYRSRALREFFRGKLMSDISTFQGEGYKMARAKLVDKKTVHRELSLARQIIEKAIDWDKFNGPNPFDKVKKFEIPKDKRTLPLTNDEVEALRDAVTHPVKRDMIEFAFYTGWRISEIRNLKWEDLDPENKTAWIVNPKNNISVEIDLKDEALNVIQRQKKRGQYVFCHLNGQPFKTNLHEVIRAAAKRAGVSLPPRKAWHIFRHTFAYNMVRAGCDIATLQKFGNWQDFHMPLHYSGAAKQDVRRNLLSKTPALKQNGRKAGEKGSNENTTI